jgi:two-component system chemotaxis sensor kinase CheA
MNTPGQPGKHSLVVLHSGRRRAAVAVDAFLGEQEVAVKSLGPRFSSFTHLLGATVLSDGRVAVLLSSTSIVDWVMARKAIAPVLQPVTGTPKKKRIILADDSVTTRALEQTILEASGFDVIAVADGKSAWDVLEEYGADAVVTDVEMPRLTGLELTRRIRSSGRFSSLPVVLVTALAREADRVAGLEAGANAYIVKSSFDQRELLESLSLLL